MSYTSIVKDEILNNMNFYKEEKIVELFSFFSSQNCIQKNKLQFLVENLSIAKRVYALLKDICDLKITIKYLTSSRLGIHKTFEIIVENQKGFQELKQLLNLSLEQILEKEQYIKSYIRGQFLMYGYLKDPKYEYSLDFFLSEEKQGKILYNVLQKLGKNCFITKKKNKTIVYVRNSEDILDILVMCGCMQSFFAYEEIIMVKELKNKTVREMNWEVANETKKLFTCKNQLNMIEYIKNAGKFNFMPKTLIEIAESRINNPESSFLELAEILNISKSGVKNRFKRLENFYNELLKNKNEEKCKS